MHLDAVQRILGVLLMVFSFTMLPPALMSAIVADGAVIPFLAAFAVVLSAGALLWLPVRHTRRDLKTRDGFFIVAMFWTVLSLAGALPLALAEAPRMSITDAVFEAVSGLTTTGATVIVGIDELPLSIRYYRQQLQWLGGMGIIVLAVAILPMLGIGGMQLYRAEMPGPVKDAKLTPRITETAKVFWYLYLGLTVVCAVAYWLAGMTLFDAISHSFTTVATAGFSTHDASIGYFDSALIEAIAIVFMFAGGINFSLHFVAWRRLSVRPYTTDSEFQFYAKVLVTSALVVSAVLLATEFYPETSRNIRHAIFQVVSFGTTTGFTTAAFYDWPAFVPLLLLILGMIGASASSTSGGIKQLRIMLLFKQGYREILRLIHPQAQILVKLGQREVSERVIDAVWGFFATYIAVFVVFLLLLMALGLDQITAFSALASAMSNLGPGLGKVSAHWADIPSTAKWLLSLAMIMGRLEIFTLLVLFTPAFWRR
jgi:trk system potassium uptake protein TrkH